MKLEPIITEKTLNAAKRGEYTFRVGVGLNKHQIRSLIEKVFDVHVVAVRTMNVAGEVKRAYTGKRKEIKPSKKAIVTLKDKEKIALFDESKK
jgi:large subunit ribosomal protein L23